MIMVELAHNYNQLQNMIVELEKAHHVFLTPSGFASVALAINEYL